MASRTDELRKRLEKDPGSRLFAQLAEELRKAGDLDEAVAVCRKGLEKHPAYPSAHMTLGRALFDKGELADARAELESVLRGAADNILASRLLGECLEGLGAVPEAIEQYKKTLLLTPGEPNVVKRLANLEAGGEPSKAVSAAAPVGQPPAEETPAPEAPASAREPSEAVEQPASASAGAPPPVEPASQPSPAQVAGAPAAPAEPAPLPETAPAPAATAPVTPPASGPPAGPQAGTEKPATPRAPAAQGAAPETAEPAAGGEPKQPTAGSERFPGMTDTESSLIGITVGETTDVPAAAAASGDIISATLAEVHVEQGHTDEARAMYRKLVEREPQNEQARRRLNELESVAAAERSPGDRKTIVRRQIAALERMLAGVPRG